MAERSIFCFGDSNTWGYIPTDDSNPLQYRRYGRDIRWPSVLESLLGPGHRVYDYGICGLAGAMVSGEGMLEDGMSRAAIDHVKGAIAAHVPIDDLVVMLGTNDVAHPARPSPATIAVGIAASVRHGLATASFYGSTPVVWLVSPIPLGEEVLSFEAGASAIELSRGLAPALYEQASRNGWRFFDAATAGPLEGGDGVHWSAGHHRRFAELMATTLRRT
jgi:hypothetical protein